MSYALHKFAIGRLGRHSIKNANARDILEVCPHLSEDQVSEVISNMGKGEISSFAIPPIFINGGFWHADYLNHGLDLCDTQSDLWLSFFPKRVPESYDQDDKDNCEVFSNCLFWKEAMEFAKTHWPDELIVDNFVDVYELHIDNLNFCDSCGHPRNEHSIFIGLNKKLDKMANECFDDAIGLMMADDLKGRELLANHDPTVYHRCALCGDVLDYDCGCHRVKPGIYPVSDKDRAVPLLSPKVLDFLSKEKGFKLLYAT